MSEIKDRINAWHEEAMDLAEKAFFAKRRNEQLNYFKHIQRALNYEKAAARLLKNNPGSEPSRSVLYKGAVHLALGIDNFDDARQLISEALSGNPPEEIRKELESLHADFVKRERIRTRVSTIAQGYLDEQDELEPENIEKALHAAFVSVEAFYGKETLDQLLNRLALQMSLESKNLVSNPNYQIFEYQGPDTKWIEERKERTNWTFWDAYKKYLDDKGLASTTIKKLDQLTDDILNRIGDPNKAGVWDKRGMVVGDVQSGKTSNYIGLINKAADAGFRIIIILTGLYENLRQQTQERVDEGFSGFPSEPGNTDAIGVGKFRKRIPVHPITHTGDGGDLRAANLKNLPLNTNDYYAVVIKKNATVLKNLLTWLYARGDEDGEYRIIKNIPLLIIDDEADYASINVDKEFVSKINGSIRATLALFEQSAFIGYTATPFANIFISDHNETEGKDIVIDEKRFRLGQELFPKDFIINLPPPSNYIGYSKVFNTDPDLNPEEGELPMIITIDDFAQSIPAGHVKDDELPDDIPESLKNAVHCFIIACAIRGARGQQNEHNSMLVHVSWYVRWIDRIAELINDYLNLIKDRIRYDQQGSVTDLLKEVWEKEFKGRTERIAGRVGYEDPRLIEHEWDEIIPFLTDAAEKIEVRAVHGQKKGEHFENTTPLNYNKYENGLSVIAVGGNKLSRGLTLEGLSISYFLRATKFYDTLLQMGRWFGYRPGYADLCRLFITEELVTWYQYIGNATEGLKEQIDIMELADRTPDKFGLKVRSAPGTLMISAAAKMKGAIDLNLSYSGELLETYILSKSESILGKNLKAMTDLIGNLGSVSGKKRQGQSFLWENIHYDTIDRFLEQYQIRQQNLRSDFIRGYIYKQVKKANLNNWTVVVINNSDAEKIYKTENGSQSISVGLTMRHEAIRKKNGIEYTDAENYIIRKSHIISPPHEFIDMDETDERYIRALSLTRQNAKTKNPPKHPVGKYVRKFRGSKQALLLIYLLDPSGFGGTSDIPAVGYAISLPEIDNDEKYPYKVNKQFMFEVFDYPADADENPETEEED
jgi:hypothetical protein